MARDWISKPVPPVTSAPLFPEGARKRYDPRAPSKGGRPVPPTPPGQVVSMDPGMLRHGEGWPAGTLAFRLGGEWVYGVLSRVEDAGRA